MAKYTTVPIEMPFNEYAAYYDLLYKDKNYSKESQYIHNLIQKFNPKAKTILSLGCGTGRYENELSLFGYTITGVDISPKMIKIAHKNRNKNCSFIIGDIRNIELRYKFDVVISLFHVMSYMISREDLSRAFETAGKHLCPEGVFIFDFWYGPAVLKDPPYIREKNFENDSYRITRKAMPEVNTENQLVKINYKIDVFDKNKLTTRSFYEVHNLRYLFMIELEEIFKKASLNSIKKLEWLSYDKEPDSNSWYALAISFKGTQYV